MTESLAVNHPRTRISSTEVEEAAKQLVREVRDLFEQYRREVPKKRKPWPESIRRRIIELWAMGMSSHQIGIEAAVPIQTLYSWRQRIKKEQRSGFSEIAITRGSRRAGFQIREDEERRRSGLQLSQLEEMPTTVANPPLFATFVLPSGIRIEGVPVDQISRVVRELAE